MDYKVWTCKIVVPSDAELPVGFDGPPRNAAKSAVIHHGIDIVACFSGWGGQLTAAEFEAIEQWDKATIKG